METLNKLNIFLIDEKKTNKIKILELFFNYPQPMLALEAKLYLRNMFDSDFNDYINKLNENIDARHPIAIWLYKKYFTNEQNELGWNKSETNRLKKIITKFLNAI